MIWRNLHYWTFLCSELPPYAQNYLHLTAMPTKQRFGVDRGFELDLELEKNKPYTTATCSWYPAINGLKMLAKSFHRKLKDSPVVIDIYCYRH